MKRLIPSALIAAALLGSVGQLARAQTTRPFGDRAAPAPPSNPEYRQDYRDQGTYRGNFPDQGTYRQDYRYQGTYHRSYGGWGLLGLSGLLGLLGARRSRAYDSAARTYYESTRPMYESTGPTFDQRPLHQPT